MTRGERKHVSRFGVERVARMYRWNKDAAQALRISERTFLGRCHQYGIETPSERRKREWEEWNARRRRKRSRGQEKAGRPL